MQIKQKNAFFSLVLILELLSVACCLKKWLSFAKKERKINIRETTEQKIAQGIYNEYGVGDRKTICKSRDGKTSIINGYGLCKLALKKLYPELSESFDVSCNHVMVGIPDKYARRKFVSHTESLLYHKMVTCDLKNFKLEIMHAIENFYYIYEHKGNSIQTPTACLKLIPQDSDFPTIPIEETIDPDKLDKIFGFYGVGKFTNTQDDGHVCKKIENTGPMLGKEICKKLSDKLKWNFMPGIEVECVKIQIKRFPTFDKSWGWPLKSPKLFGTKCQISLKDEKKEMPIIIINHSNQNYYYVAESDDKFGWWIKHLIQLTIN